MRGKRELEELLADIVDQHELKQVAVQAEYLRVAERKNIAERIGSDRVLDVDDGLIQQRSVKDVTEIDSIRQAIAIQQQAFLQTRDYIRPGMTEAEIAGYLEYQARILGADEMSFPTIVAADANAALPHYLAGQAKVKEGGMLLIDWGVRYQGYCSDMTRVLALGKMPAKIREIYDVVRQAYQAGVEAIRPGASQVAVDQAARDVIQQAGFGEHFGHALGHGIGLDIHEQPRLSFRQDGELLANQVVTVEPGIYLQGIGGVRLENDVVVTEDGAEVLCDLPLDAEWAVIETKEGRVPAPHYADEKGVRTAL
jgi:Xaa-Pro aminopeptidase